MSVTRSDDGAPLITDRRRQRREAGGGGGRGEGRAEKGTRDRRGVRKRFRKTGVRLGEEGAEREASPETSAIGEGQEVSSTGQVNGGKPPQGPLDLQRSESVTDG